MRHNTLGNTALSVSPICLGTMTFGAQTDQATAASMLDMCLDAGINFVDTANKYNDGRSEEILGHIVKDRRDRIVLASKVFGKMGDGPNESGLSKAAVLRAINDSLRRLRTDYLDIFYLHQPDYSVPLEETLEVLDQLVRDGKIRWVGASNYAAWQVCQALWIAQSRGYQPMAVMQPMYNLLARGIEQEFLPMCKEFGLGTVVYNPLAGGLLTGKHSPSKPEAGSRFDTNEQYVDRYWHQTNFEFVERLGAAARDCGRTPISIAFNWLIHHSTVDCLILGASKLEHLKQNLGAIEEGPLSAETVETCDEVWRMVRGNSPVYNR